MLSASTPQREICAQLHIGRGVLNRYKRSWLMKPKLITAQ